MLNIEKYKEDILNSPQANITCCANNLRHDETCANKSCIACKKEALKWLLSEYQILDDAEKRYLRGVIRPFRDKVESISKITERWNSEEICIYVNNDGKGKCDDVVYLPQFERGKLYQGMEACKEYTLEELGL